MKVNGQNVPVQPGTTLQAYLEENGYSGERVAVERNGEIIKRAVWSETVLSDTDTVEIVQFVGGG